MTATLAIPTTERKTKVLGVDLEGITSIEQALDVAGLNWGIQIEDADNLAITTEEGVLNTSIPGMRLVMRDDTNLTLGVVGGRYHPVDNKSVFAMGEHILNQGGVLAEGGTLDRGRKAFMRFDLPGTSVEVGGKDLIKFGVVIRANHDGSGTVTAGIEGHRLVCTNGMTVKMKGLAHQFTIRHTASAHDRLGEAQRVLRGTMQYAKSFAAVAEEMLSRKFTETDFKRYIEALYPRPSEDEKRATTLWENRRSELMALYRFADTNDLGRGTQWGAFNSVVEYLDWGAPVRVSNRTTTDEVRARRQFEGSNQAMKDQAFDLLIPA